MLLEKQKNTWFLNTHRNQVIYIFIKNSRSKQNKNYLVHRFVDIVKQETCVNIQQKI